MTQTQDELQEEREQLFRELEALCGKDIILFG